MTLMLSRRRFLGAVVAAGGSALLAACQPARATQPAPTAAGPGQTPDAWAKLVEAARGEGVVTVYDGPGRALNEVLVESFQRAYPDIKVQGTFVPFPDLLALISSERTAGKYLADVTVSLGASGVITLKPSGALVPLQPALFLPEVLDTSLWYENRHWWVDAEEPMTTLVYQGAVQVTISHNRQLVEPSEFSSWYDLLAPKWRGKIVMVDTRNAFGAQALRFIYSNPELGPRFLERLWSEMDLTFSNDQRQMADWIAQGRFHLGISVSPTEIRVAAEQGLPVGFVPPERFREGAIISGGGGSISLMDRAPHPNAAKLYVNWLLSQDGQLAWQRGVQENSLRTDIPKDMVRQEGIPRPGVKYVVAVTEDFARLDAEIAELTSRVLRG